MKRDKHRFLLLVLVPCFSAVFIFLVLPIIGTFLISFMEYNPLRNENTFVGLSNYARMLQKQDNPACVGWYEKSMQLGEADAAYRLFELYDRGHLVPQDDQKAISYLQAASTMGKNDATVALALAYSH